MRYLVLLLSVLSSCRVSAQHSLSFKLGFNSNTYGAADEQNGVQIHYMPSWRLQLGFAYTYSISEHSQLLAEAQYALRGTDYRIDYIKGGAVGSQIRMYYAELPVSYRLSFGKKKKLSVHAGAYFGIRLKTMPGAADNIAYMGLSDGHTIYYGRFHPYSFGVHAGAGYQFRHFSMGYRLSSGLAPEVSFGENFSPRDKNTFSHNLYVYIPLFVREKLSPAARSRIGGGGL